MIPAKNLNYIIRILGEVNGDINVSIADNQVVCTADDLYCTTRLIDGMYPDYTRIIPDEETTTVTVLKSDLVQTLKMLGIFSDKLNQVEFEINPAEKVCRFTTQNSDKGDTMSDIQAALDGDPLTLVFNLKYLSDAMQSIATDSLVISLTQPNRPMIVQGVSDNSFLYLISPINRS